jgi:hypothetical protein
MMLYRRTLVVAKSQQRPELLCDGYIVSSVTLRHTHDERLLLTCNRRCLEVNLSVVDMRVRNLGTARHERIPDVGLREDSAGEADAGVRHVRGLELVEVGQPERAVRR